jgi:hypothetical protein
MITQSISKNIRFMIENMTRLQLEDVIHSPTSGVLGLSSTFKVDELIGHIREIAYEKFSSQNLYVFDSDGCRLIFFGRTILDGRPERLEFP